MMNKKAQLTWFLLVGLIIVIGAFVFMYIRTIGVEKEFAEPKIAEVPVEFVPVVSQVEGCMMKVAEDGLRILGSHGGYINLSRFGFYTAPADPTSANAVKFSPGSSLDIPYWYHLKSPNTCTGKCEFSYGLPYLRREQGNPSIEAQLDDYINNNLKGCINDFADLKALGYKINEIGNLKATVAVTAHDVAVLVEYPVRASKEATATIEKYFVRLPVDLAVIYEQATLLTNLEAHYKYIERNMMNIITAFSAIDKDRLPAMSGITFDLGGGITWRKSKVREMLQQILSTYIQMMQVYNSYNYRRISVPTGSSIADALYNEGMLIPSNESYSNLAVSFNYLTFWPIYFDLNCNGEVCGPESVSENIMSMLGIQRYNFVYDLSFPVLVEINDPAAFNSQGYGFSFMLEANIRSNNPMPSEFSPIEPLNILGASMLCNPGQANSGNITVFVSDSSNSPVSDAEVVYSCGAESCMVGRTDEIGIFAGKFPLCLGGIVSFLKDGYIATSQQLSTVLDRDASISAVIYPISELNLTVMKKKVVKSPDGSWYFRDIPLMLANEDAVITMTRHGALNDREFFATAVYPEEPNTIRVAPGNYNIEIIMRRNQDLIMPSQEICGADTCARVPQVKINDSYTSGGLSINYTFSPEELAKGKLTFYTLGIDVGEIPDSQKELQDFSQISRIGEYSNAYYSSLKPSFG